MTKRIFILTGSELRHDFFRKALALSDGINVIGSYREYTGGPSSIDDQYKGRRKNLEYEHFKARARSEDDFFGAFVRITKDLSHPVNLTWKGVREPDRAEYIIRAEPDLLVAFGCSIIKDPLLSHFAGRILNLHLGLSPYYRGSGTNFWPLVNGEPEFVGVTFMYMDEGVDTGEIIHQIRARIYPNDTPHNIGNRLIVDMTETCIEIVKKFEDLDPMPQPPERHVTYYYRTKDFSINSVEKLYRRFADRLILEYLEEQRERTASVPIVTNSALVKRKRS